VVDPVEVTDDDCDVVPLLVPEVVAVVDTDEAAVLDTDDVAVVDCDDVAVVDLDEVAVLLMLVVAVEVGVVVTVVFVQSENAPSSFLFAAMLTLYTASEQSASSTTKIWLSIHEKADL